MKQIVSIWTLICFVMNYFLIGMDNPANKRALYAKLLIDQREYFQSYAQHSHKPDRAIAYMVQQDRQTYPLAEAYKKSPLKTPFVHIKIIPESNLHKAILTIIPAQKLINCTDGSRLDITSNDCIFHLTCAKNDRFIIDEKYFPQDKQSTGFEQQFLSSMNEFYDSPDYSYHSSTRNELISQHILKSIIQMHTMNLSPTNLVWTRNTFYTHGPQGCSSPQHLIDLATNIKTKTNQYSKFHYVTRREYGNRLQPKCNLSVNFNCIIATCLKEVEYEDKFREKILNECLDELLIVPKLLARICINQLVMRTFTRFIINRQLQKK